MPNAKDGRRFTLHVVGVTHKNEGGRNRQQVIRDCSRGEAVDLVPEPDNKFDSNAIKACRRNGEQIGYIDATNASRLTLDMESGRRYRVTVDDILHKEGTKSYGLLLQFEVLATSHASAALKETAMKTCACGTENPPNANFCGHCRSKFTDRTNLVRCSCGASISKKANVCPQCGHRYQSASSLILFLLIPLIGLLAAVYSCSSPR